MASPEVELEDRLQEVGNRLASPPSAVDDLLALLDQIESFLSRVDQSPSQSMSAALRPAMKALVSKELLEHSDMDVKVAVASCISEITRITAPDAPYDDDLMKVIFQMIVEAFGKLDDIYSRSYSKRISILETVAKVRSCVVMLDLECDALILEMFHHFLKAIRPNHPENVISSMETIMTLVLEESEDISSELLSSLLDSVKKDKEVLPIARRLGEKVIGNCAAKLKPYLMEVVQSLCAREYSKIVASICQENSEALEHTEINVSGEILADDSKLSERTVSDELPQGSAKLEQEVGSLEKVGTADKSPRPMMSNGIVQTGDGDSVVEPTSPKQKPERSRRNGQSTNLASDRPTSDNLEAVAVKSDSLIDLKTRKARGRKANSSVHLPDTMDHVPNDSDKEATPLSSRTGRSNEVDNPQMDGPSGKEAESAASLEPEEKNDLQSTHRSDNGTECISSPTPSESVLDAGRPKRGRPPGSKVSAKRGVNSIADQPASPSKEKGSQTKDDSLPAEDNDSKKDHGAISKSEGKSLRRTGKKVPAENADGVAVAPVSVTSDSEGKPAGQAGKKGSRKKVMDRESSGEQQKSDIKQPRRNLSLGKDAAGELSLKDVPSTEKSDTKTQSKDQNHLEDTIKTQSRRKRARGTDKISETPETKNKLDQDLVGSRVQVWWPDDNKYYSGKIDAFDPVSGKHTIIYDDGDLEVLCLKEELYKLVEGGSETEGGQATDVPSSIASPEVQRNKKAKTISDPVPDVTPLKSGTESSGEHDGRVTKPKGRPKGRPSNLSNETTKTSRKSNEKSASKSEDVTPKTGDKLKGSGKKIKSDTSETGTKDETPRSGSKPKDAPLKTGRKPRDDTPKTSSKLKDGTPNTGSKSKDEPMEESSRASKKSKAKSKEETPKTAGTTKPKGGVTPKSGGTGGGASEKGKVKVPDSAMTPPAKAQESGGGTSGKRKRKGGRGGRK